VGSVEESLIKKLIASKKCGVCGKRYVVDNLSILGHRQDLWYLKAHCLACHTQSLIAVVVKEDRLTEPVSDLTGREVDRFKDAGVITADEVLDMHNFLKDFKGDLSHLVNREHAGG
jgi:hypothetical protein